MYIFSKSYFLFVLLVFSYTDSFSQARSREELEREKKENLEKIKETKKVLNQTQQQKNASLSQVKALNQQIAAQEQQLYLMEQEIGMISMEMQELEKATAELETKLVLLRKEYAEMMYRSSKISGQVNQLSFLFSSSSFTELIMRYKYLQQYADDRETQIEQIRKVAALLEERKMSLTAKRQSHQTVIVSKQSETRNLELLKNEKNRVVTDLSKQEKQLLTEIANTQRSVKKLNQVISSIVSREISRRNKVREENKDKPTTEVVLRGNSFGANKKRLPWPVQNGFVSDKFGVKNHAVLKGVQVDNNGVTIQTGSSATVRAVFDGTVMDISEIPGLNKVVAIQHGDYYTIYANLREVFVSANQTVSSKETIGTAAQTDGITEINFQIWHKFQRLNPEGWLAGK